jgi:hypothetical protein
MDGTRSFDQLAAKSATDFPELDFPRWMDHLAGRGILC